MRTRRVVERLVDEVIDETMKRHRFVVAFHDDIRFLLHLVGEPDPGPLRPPPWIVADLHSNTNP